MYNIISYHIISYYTMNELDLYIYCYDSNYTNKFKEIAEAYDTLGDEQKRKTYNLYGSSENNFAEDPFSMFNDIFSSHMSFHFFISCLYSM